MPAMARDMLGSRCDANRDHWVRGIGTRFAGKQIRCQKIRNPDFWRVRADLTAPPNMTFRQIASALKVSVATAHKLHKSGMPTDSAEAAQEWVRERAKTAPAASDTTSLAAKRGRKLDLECQLLALRIERESSNAEFLEVTEAIASIRLFLTLSLISLKTRSDAAVERLAGETDFVRVATILGDIHSGAWLEATSTMMRRCRQDRMAAAIAATIKAEFTLITDETLAELGRVS